MASTRPSIISKKEMKSFDFKLPACKNTLQSKRERKKEGSIPKKKGVADLKESEKVLRKEKKNIWKLRLLLKEVTSPGPAEPQRENNFHQRTLGGTRKKKRGFLSKENPKKQKNSKEKRVEQEIIDKSKEEIKSLVERHSFPLQLIKQRAFWAQSVQKKSLSEQNENFGSSGVSLEIDYLWGDQLPIPVDYII